MSKSIGGLTRRPSSSELDYWIRPSYQGDKYVAHFLKRRQRGKLGFNFLKLI